MTRYIDRPEYMDALRRFQGNDLIRIVTGVRRCGKSTLLKMYREGLEAQGVPRDHLVTVDLEDFEHFELRKPQNLHAYLKSRLREDGATYIFLDEAQLCSGFEDVVNSLNRRDDVALFLTGSSGVLLSGELATRLAGRYIETQMLPLSFREFCSARDQSLTDAYADYVVRSAFPYAVRLDEFESMEYLHMLYDSVVARDLTVRHGRLDTQRMLPVLSFLMDTIGNRISPKKIADTLTAAGNKIDVKTVNQYLGAFEDSFLLYRAKRFDIRGKEHLRTLEKFYAVDAGLRRMLIGGRTADVGSTLENVVYLELRRRGYDVFVGKMDDREVDFVAVRPGQTRYYQVAATVRDESVLRRELFPLEHIRDQYPKTLLTLDPDPLQNHNGIRQLNALDWLLNPALD